MCKLRGQRIDSNMSLSTNNKRQQSHIKYLFRLLRLQLRNQHSMCKIGTTAICSSSSYTSKC